MWGSMWDVVTKGEKQEEKKVKSTTQGSKLSGHISWSLEECFYKTT